MRQKRYRFHPICLLFPRLGDQELQELAADIKLKGLLHPIVLYQGMILNGRNRYLACRIAGVKPRFVTWKGPGSPLETVVSDNLFRRHLTSSQRAVVAHDLLPMMEAEAKERQRLSRGRGKKVSQDWDTFSENGAASKVAARLFRTSSTYVHAVKAMKAAAPNSSRKCDPARSPCPRLGNWHARPGRYAGRSCVSSMATGRGGRCRGSSGRRRLPSGSPPHVVSPTPTERAPTRTSFMATCQSCGSDLPIPR